MALKGDLLAGELVNVLQLSALNRRRGLLTVQDRANPAVRRRLYLDGDRIRTVDDPAPLQAALLLAAGRLGYAPFGAVRRHAASFAGNAAGFLRSRGELDARAEAEWRIASDREEMLEVFLWRDIRFVLDEGAPSPTDARPTLSLDELVMEAARRQDETGRIDAALGDGRPILRRTETPPPEDLPAVRRVVLDEIDGVKGVQELAASTGLPRFHVEAASVELLADSLVALVPQSELVDLGDRLSADGRPEDALRVWRNALRDARLDLELHKRLANVLADVGRPAKACAHWRFVAGALAREGRSREALDLYHLAWRMLPARFATLETLVGLLDEALIPWTREDRDALADARKLLFALSDLGEHARALALADVLRRLAPEDRDVLAAAARLNLRLGRREAAASAWLALADRQAEEGELRRALETVRTVASFDPANGKLYELRVADLSRRLEDSRRVRSRGRAKRVALAALLAASAWYAAYAWRAERKVAVLEARSTESVAEAEEVALEAAEIVRWYSLAPAGDRARRKGLSASSAAASFREEKRRRDEAASADRSSRRVESERLRRSAAEAMRSGGIEDAADLLRRSLAIAPSRSTADAIAAAGELDELERYLKGARDALAEAAAVEASDPDRAYAIRLDAVRKFDLAPEAAAARFTLLVVTAPPGAWISADDGAFEGRAPLLVTVGRKGALKIDARAEGCAPRRAAIPLPSTTRNVLVVLERTPEATVVTGEPCLGAAGAGPRRAVVAARNGRVLGVDLSTGAVDWRFAPEAIESLRRAPLIAGDAALCIAENGRARVLDVRTGAVRAELRFRVGARAEVVEDGFVALDGRALIRIDLAGRASPLGDLPEGTVVADLAAVRDAVYAAAPQSGLYRARSGGNPELVASGRVASVVATASGAAFVRIGEGLSVVDAAGARVVLQDAEARSVFDAGGGRYWLRTGARGLAVLDRSGRVLGSLELPQDAADAKPALDPSAGRAAFALVSGWTCVVDATRCVVVAGHATDTGAQPGLGYGLYLDPREDGRLLVVRDG